MCNKGASEQGIVCGRPVTFAQIIEDKDNGSESESESEYWRETLHKSGMVGGSHVDHL